MLIAAVTGMRLSRLLREVTAGSPHLYCHPPYSPAARKMWASCSCN